MRPIDVRAAVLALTWLDVLDGSPEAVALAQVSRKSLDACLALRWLVRQHGCVVLTEAGHRALEGNRRAQLFSEAHPETER